MDQKTQYKFNKINKLQVARRVINQKIQDLENQIKHQQSFLNLTNNLIQKLK